MRAEDRLSRPFPFRRFSYGPTLNPTGRVRAVISASERFFRRFAEQSIGERFFRCRCWAIRGREMYERPRAFCHTTCLQSKQYDVHIPSSIHQPHEPPHPLPVILWVNSLPFLRFLDQARFNGLGKGENPGHALILTAHIFGIAPSLRRAVSSTFSFGKQHLWGIA
jgi:hypothetical protein